MRNKLIFLAALATIPIPALAAKPVTVDQLQQTLAAAQSAHRSDDATELKLEDVKLTARLTGGALQQLVAISPGPKTTQALHVIADASAFLDPPPSELPATPAPDIATQKAIMGRTVDYVVHALPALPNFLATRATERYADTLRGMEQESVQRGGLYWLGNISAPISYRDGRETDDPTLTPKPAVSGKPAFSGKKDHAKGAIAPPGPSGLSSWGEFGPILGVVLLDSAKGKLSWARWEQQDGKQAAVFQFSVDRSISHYSLNYCCELSMTTMGSLAPPLNNIALKPGYHGRIEVDPETGTILRITIEADLRHEDPIQRASMMVEYGPVKIGAAVRFCPTRSVSISVARAEFLSHGVFEATNRLQLNDVEFVDYHRFGSESAVITALPDGAVQTGQASQPAEAARATEPAPAPAERTVVETAAKLDAAPASAAALPIVAAAPSGTPPAEAEAEIQVHALEGPPEAAGGDKNSGTFTLKVTTRSVDVGLIADDKHGKPVVDLKQDEINVFDNGRKQQLSVFRHATPDAASLESSPQPSEPADTFTNTSPVTAHIEDVPDTLVLLMDESHLAYVDLNRARAEVLRFLAATRPNTRVALYSISEKGFHVIQDVTQDHALVAKKLAAWVPDASAVSQAQALERRNRQQFDTVHNTQDLNSVNGNYIDAPLTAQTTDPELRQMGDNPLSYALEGMMAMARHFAPAPGHKSMVWISGDSVLADWEDQSVGVDKGGKQLEAVMLHAREALDEAHISLYAVNASAVEGGAIDPSLKNRNVELNPADQNGPAPRNNTPGRVTAQMQQDEHGIQDPVRQLAEATGGRAVNKGGDLKATLDGIDQDSAGLYELGFNPDTPADGKFHTLQVKVQGRKNVSLRYRSGYLYAEESVNKQQRLQQAIWSPQDSTGIALTAVAVAAADSASGSSTVRLRIGFPGLALEQKNGRWTDDLYIFVAQRDDAVRKAEISGDTLRLSLKQATFGSGMPAGIPYQRAVETKSKLGSVRIIVVDGNSGKMGSVTLPASALQP